MILFPPTLIVRVKSSSVTGGALSAQILLAKASTGSRRSSAFYQHCSKRNNNNNTSAMRSCLQVFNAVSDYAGAEDQGTGRVDKSQFHAAMRISNTAMAKIGRQLGGGGAATLEKVSMDLSSSVQSVAAPKLSDGDNGGNNGGKINNGGAAGRRRRRRRRLVRRRRRRRRRRRIHFFERRDPGNVRKRGDSSRVVRVV